MSNLRDIYLSPHILKDNVILMKPFKSFNKYSMKQFTNLQIFPFD